MPSKRCSKCNIKKPVDNFYKEKRGIYGVRKTCKDCVKNYTKIYREVNKDKVRKQKKVYREKNKDKIARKQARYWKENRQELSLYHKKYREQNKEKIAKEKLEYQRKRWKTDPSYRLSMIVRRSIWGSIKKTGGQKGGKTFEALPYTPQQLREHIENQFDEKKNWDNYGDYWHIDHITPQAALPYKSLEDENFQKCWALENLRPLEAKENMSKGSLYEGERRTYTNNKETNNGYQKDTG